MSNSGRGGSRTLSTASHGHPSKKKDRKNNANNVSLDLDVSYDSPANSPKSFTDPAAAETSSNLHDYYKEKFRLLEAGFAEKLKITEAGFEGKLDTLYKIIEKKDEAIAKLNEDIGDLKRSFDFMSRETS